MKHFIFTLFALLLLLSSCIPATQSLEPINTVTFAASLTSSSPATQGLSLYPAVFPLPPLPKNKILEVGACDIESMASERYQENMKESQLSEIYTPLSACDWAVLAYAYAVRNEKDLPNPLGIDALKNALEENYGYALADPIFYTYFGSIPLVSPPSLVNQEIKEIGISYYWSGLGEPSNIEYSLSIVNASANPVVQSDSSLVSSNIQIDKDVIQELSLGLRDLIPVESRISIVPCTDNYPEWRVIITFTDDTEIVMETSSNFLGLGGPWSTTIEDQTYIQVSSSFAEKIDQLAKALELPLGEPMAMTCFGDSVFEKAFSESLPPTSTPVPNFTQEAIATAAFQTIEALFTEQALYTPTP